MTRRSNDIRLRHMLDHAREAIALTQGKPHGYDAVDLDILWQIITVDLPPLVSALETILAQAAE